MRGRRYAVTDLADDLRDPRSAEELVGIGTKLYETLAECFLRGRSHWSAGGKAISRQLRMVDPVFAARFTSAFDDLFRKHDPRGVLALTEEVLRPLGRLGRPLFDGHRLDAPAAWRKEDSS